MGNARRPCRLLIVEDNRDLRELLAEILDGQGYLVDCAAHGQEALHHLQRSPAPDLILLDLMMPVMDGREFRKQQCEDPTLASIPVVIISAEEDARRVSQTLGIREHLAKPVDIDALLSVVGRYCP